MKDYNYNSNKKILFISLIIVFCLLFQFGVSFRILPSSWPFVIYGIFRTTHYAGERANFYSLMGILPDNTEIKITHDDLGQDVKWFNNYFLPAIFNNNKKYIQQSLELYQIKNNKRIVGLKLKNQPFILYKNGFLPAPPELVKTIDLEEFKNPEEKN